MTKQRLANSLMFCRTHITQTNMQVKRYKWMHISTNGCIFLNKMSCIVLIIVQSIKVALLKDKSLCYTAP